MLARNREYRVSSPRRDNALRQYLQLTRRIFVVKVSHDQSAMVSYYLPALPIPTPNLEPHPYSFGTGLSIRAEYCYVGRLAYIVMAYIFCYSFLFPPATMGTEKRGQYCGGRSYDNPGHSRL